LDIPQELADELRGDHFFWDGKENPRAVAMRIRASLVNNIFKPHKLKMKPHHFRHFFISEQLGKGFSAGEVADMVGTSEAEIRKTYKHDTKDGRERVRAKQIQVWLESGLDEHGNAPTVQ
jgi:integrase